MIVSLIVEGAYPYYTGGVSSWIQHLLLELKDVEFKIQTVVVDRKHNKQFKYKIPDNVVELREIYLQDADYTGKSKKKIKMSDEEYIAMQSLFFGEAVNWPVIFNYFRSRTVSLDALLSSKQFLKMTINYFNEHFDQIAFSDFLWTMRSMYLPLFTILKSQPVEADVYHTVSTGYAGIVGCMLKEVYKKPFILSEHGIYTREREEEIIKANWVKGVYKDLWIQQFKKCSQCCYDYADYVTCLYEGAKDLQKEFGCAEEKIRIIHNGVDADSFQRIELKRKEDSFINIGAILRITPIKDVKTLINAFYTAKRQQPNIKLYIMGPREEASEYAEECEKLVADLKLEDILFTGNVNTKDYIGKMDFLMLSSLSEGQPLVILEGFAAKKPFIVTNVGNCYGLIHGEEDDFGDAGIVVPIMNVTKMSEAILTLSKNELLRKTMGEAGYRRVMKSYKEHDIYQIYRMLYEEAVNGRNRI